MKQRTLLLAAMSLLALATVAASHAADPAAIERGRLIAEGRCSRCHAVGPSGASDQSDVIPFRRLAERFPSEMLVEALKSGVVGGHEEMPMSDLGLADVRALLAYLDSLAPAGSRYLKDLPR
ncbi:MAG TPA: cytochrome c [Hyphomicrobiaceae bacterium]|nr:cytochrome c [Hyphomicrobiaceae bacterium]